jgi:hypothetical protein
VQLWDAQTGKAISVPLIHEDTVQSAVFSPDGKRVVAASGWTPVLWEIFADTQDYVTEAKLTVPRCLTGEQRIRFFLLPAPPAWCIEMEKLPYDTQDWKDWLKFSRANLNPPLPDTPEWAPWLAQQTGYAAPGRNSK